MAGHNTNVGDEGGFRGRIWSSAENAPRLHHEFRSRPAGYKPGENMVLALDCAGDGVFQER